MLPQQREILPSTRLGTLPPAFSTRVLPAQATEYAFAFIQVPQDVSTDLILLSEGTVVTIAAALTTLLENMGMCCVVCCYGWDSGVVSFDPGN